jgi:hypothetical protein
MRNLKHYLAVAGLASGSAMAHELTPTYPKLTPSYIPGVMSTHVVLWNARQDVSYYKVEVFDENMQPVSFIATGGDLKKVDYLGRAHIEIFVREEDKDKATYICTQSKLKKGSAQRSLVASKVCSKIK